MRADGVSRRCHLGHGGGRLPVPCVCIHGRGGDDQNQKRGGQSSVLPVVAARVGLGELVILGKGMTGRRELPQSVLASVYESVVGALYLDGGLEPAQTFILRDMEDRIRRADRSGHQSNFKSVLQQVAVQRELGVPTYHVLDEKGPDHAKCFEFASNSVAIDFHLAGRPARKQAEQDAALEALHDLGLAYRGERDEVLIRLNPVE